MPAPEQPPREKSLDAVPAYLHSQYVKVQGEEGDEYEFRPPQPENTAGLKSALEKYKRKAERGDKLDEELRTYKSRWQIDGEELDPDEVLAIYQKARAQQGTEMISRAEAERIATEARQKAAQAATRTTEAKIAELTQQLADREAQIHAHVVEGGIQKAAQELSKTVRLRPNAVMALLKIAAADRSIRPIDNSAVPVDAEGRPRQNDKGEAMTAYDWVAEQVQLYGLGEESQGVGATPAQSSGPAPIGLRRGAMSTAEKADYVDKYGKEKYLNLPV